MPRINRLTAVQFLLCVSVSVSNVSVCVGQQTPEVQPATAESGPLPVDQIVSRMEERNRERTATLQKFEGRRIYRMQYKGFFGTRDAEMVVSVKASPAERQFTVESQSGSKFIIEHVFKKLLDGETEATTADNRQRTALDASNYDFTLAGFDTSAADPEYVLSVIPRAQEKFLYRGKIWVDAKDFAVTRIQAEPAKSPSMWIKSSQINHTYEKLDGFWLPAENRTDSSIRLGGHAFLSIEYKDYKITESTVLNLATSASVDGRTAVAGP